MRMFDINVGGTWITCIVADDFAQAKLIVSQTRGGEVRDHREYMLIKEKWIEVKV